VKHHLNQDAPQNNALSIIAPPVPVTIIQATYKHAASAILCGAVQKEKKIN